MPSEDSKKAALNRLASIEGHLRGIRKMVEEDQYCVDVLKQTYAVKRAIDVFESAMLRDHLASCVLEGVREGRDQEVLGELAELLDLSRRSQG
jgi:DNA-binding FrmR family transcriptional regulator